MRRSLILIAVLAFTIGCLLPACSQPPTPAQPANQPAGAAGGAAEGVIGAGHEDEDDEGEDALREARQVDVPLPDFDRLQLSLSVAGHGIRFTRASVLTDRSDENDLLKIVSRGPNSVDLDVGPLSGYRILVFLDAAYPGWNARVDANPVALYRADDAFKAIVVPPGRHRVTFAFRPWRVYVGGAISLATVAAALAILIAAWVKRHGAYAHRPS